MLVGIHGKAGSGKDTLAAILLDELRKQGIHAVRRGFGDALKEEYMELTGYTLEDIERDKPKHRVALQELGDGRRQTDPDYWIKLLMAKREQGELTVIPDVRYPNEYDLCNGGVILKVAATLEARQARREVVNDSHISETAMDHIAPEGYDLVLYNDASLEEFEQEARAWIKENLWLFLQ